MKPTKRFFIFLCGITLFLSACERNITRYDDGTVDVETVVTQQELQETITASIANPLIRELTITLQSGYILVSGTRERLNDPTKTDTLSFHLDLVVSDGQLTSTISDAQFDGFTIEQNRLDLWNTTIANKIAVLGSKSPNSTLKSVTVTPEALTMVWMAGK